MCSRIRKKEILDLQYSKDSTSATKNPLSCFIHLYPPSLCLLHFLFISTTHTEEGTELFEELRRRRLSEHNNNNNNSNNSNSTFTLLRTTEEEPKVQAKGRKEENKMKKQLQSEKQKLQQQQLQKWSKKLNEDEKVAAVARAISSFDRVSFNSNVLKLHDELGDAKTRYSHIF